MTTLTIQAFEAGYKAAQEGKPRAPAASKTCMNIIAKVDLPNLAAHDSVMNIMENFIKGYETQVNEECAKLLQAA